MDNNGITRRIDDLGRIVVPKELRNNLGIRDGEPLLIQCSNDSIIIKKFSKVETIKDKSENISKIIRDIMNVNILITDREKVIINESNYEVNNNKLSDYIKNLIDNREIYNKDEVLKEFNILGYYLMVPIITSSDCIGIVIIFSESNKVSGYLDIAKIISKLIIS